VSVAGYGCYLSPVLRASRWPERLNEWQEVLCSTFLPSRGFTFHLPRVLRLSIFLTPSQNPLGCQPPYQIRSLKRNCWESSLYLLSKRTPLFSCWIHHKCSIAPTAPEVVGSRNWNIHTAPSHSKPTILAAVQCICQSASDVLIASHGLKSKLELHKNFANRSASRNHFEMPASVSRRQHNFLDSASSILRNKADV